MTGVSSDIAGGQAGRRGEQWHQVRHCALLPSTVCIVADAAFGVGGCPVVPPALRTAVARSAISA